MCTAADWRFRIFQDSEGAGMVDGDVLKKIVDNAQKIANDCEYSASSNFALGKYWDTWNLRLGLSAAILSALAAIINVDKMNLLSSVQHFPIAGVVGFFAAVSASVLTFLKPSEKASIYREFGNKYRSLRDRSRVFISIDCLVTTEYEKLRGALDALLKEKEDLNLDNPVIPEWVFVEAQRLIKQKLNRKTAAPK
jgi:hypothetical protein